MGARKWAVMVTVGLLSDASYAANWVRVTGSDQAVVYVDTVSIAPRANLKQAWLLWDWFEDQKTTTVYPQKTYRSSKNLAVFDCSRRASVHIQSVMYSGDTGEGAVVESNVFNFSPASLRDVVPDSVGEAILERVCNPPVGSPVPPSPRPAKRGTL